MTAIAGIIDSEGTAHVMADSCISFGDSYVISPESKIFKKADLALIGATGTARYLDILKYNLIMPEFQGEDVKEYLVKLLVPQIAKTLIEFGYLLSLSEWEIDRTLIAMEGEMYVISCNGYVQPVTEAAIGSGENYAVSSLFTTRNLGLSPKKRLKMAMKAAEDRVHSVRRPFKYMTLEKETR